MVDKIDFLEYFSTMTSNKNNDALESLNSLQWIALASLGTHFSSETFISYAYKMVHKCCAFKCGLTQTKDCSVTFHSFPLNDPELCAKWQPGGRISNLLYPIVSAVSILHLTISISQIQRNRNRVLCHQSEKVTFVESTYVTFSEWCIPDDEWNKLRSPNP